MNRYRKGFLWDRSAIPIEKKMSSAYPKLWRVRKAESCSYQLCWTHLMTFERKVLLKRVMTVFTTSRFKRLWSVWVSHEALAVSLRDSLGMITSGPTMGWNIPTSLTQERNSYAQWCHRVHSCHSVRAENVTDFVAIETNRSVTLKTWLEKQRTCLSWVL